MTTAALAYDLAGRDAERSKQRDGAIMGTVLGLAGRIGSDRSSRIDVLSLYWHFVDAVWVVVFTVVYIIGR